MSSSYQVIARKWRPQTFDDVVGQDHVVRTLKNAIGRNRIAHAYLLVGPRGTGKTSTARIFAKALNCTGGPKADFPPDDPAVKAIAEGSHLDVIEIDGASNNGVEQVRELRDTARYAPAQGKFKIYIIDEVHMLSAAAFNALLKTLEEPPEHVKFVFATTDVQKVLPTILSRCQRFDLKPIAPELIVGRLKQIAKEEKIEISEAALACIARLADGGMRDAQSIFDQMISFCGGKIAEADVLDVYGLVSAEKVAELAAALAAGDQQRIVALVDECDAAGRDLVRLLADLQVQVRAALLDAIAQRGTSSRLGGTALSTEQLTRLLDALREGEGGVKLGLAEKVNFEVTLLKAIEASRSRAIDSLIKELVALAGEDGGAPAEVPEGGAKKKKYRLAELERRLGGGPVRPETGPVTAAPAPVPAEGSPEGEGPGWPGEADEAAFLSAARDSGEAPGPAARPPAAPAEPAGPLPPLEELAGRVPPAVRAALDELFRAKLSAVRRIPAEALEPSAPK